jgi:hypothetical protein
VSTRAASWSEKEGLSNGVTHSDRILSPVYFMRLWAKKEDKSFSISNSCDDYINRKPFFFSDHDAANVTPPIGSVK